GERTKYTPGTFSWTDLTTPDQDAAKRFYGELLGWELIDNPVGDGVVYTTAQIGGKDVAAISPQPQQQRDAGAPPAWNSYITVENADQSLARAKQLGGTVHAPAFDVMTVGRMGVIQDPHGAYFLVWEPREHIGASLVNAPGAISWNELASPDPQASAAFYGGLFGWQTTAMEGMDFPYLVIQNADGHSNGGIAPVMPPVPRRTGSCTSARTTSTPIWPRSPSSAGRRWSGRLTSAWARSRLLRIRRARGSRSSPGVPTTARRRRPTAAQTPPAIIGSCDHAEPRRSRCSCCWRC